MMWIGLAILAAGAIVLVLMDDPGTIFGVTDSGFAQIISASALLLLIGVPLLWSYRGRMGEAARHAATWLGIALAILVFYTYRTEMIDVSQRVMSEVMPGFAVSQNETGADGQLHRVVTISADASGHFNVRADVDGHTIPMMVDTGATTVTLSYEDAARIGIDTDNLYFSVNVHTANGIGNAAEVRLRTLSVGDLQVEGLRALVTQPGAMRGSLLGMNFLRSLESFEIRGDRLILKG